jgi:hypothetical protein
VPGIRLAAKPLEFGPGVDTGVVNDVTQLAPPLPGNDTLTNCAGGNAAPADVVNAREVGAMNTSLNGMPANSNTSFDAIRIPNYVSIIDRRRSSLYTDSSGRAFGILSLPRKRLCQRRCLMTGVHGDAGHFRTNA